MNPASPVLLRNPMRLSEVVWAKNQRPYRPLPSIVTDDGFVTSRWTLSWRERVRVLFSGSIWLQLAMGIDERGHVRPLTPSIVTTVEPQFQKHGGVLDNVTLTA